MTLPIAGFLLTVSLLASVAAWAAERGLRRLALPGRWPWLAAMAAGPTLLVAPRLLPGTGAGDGGGALLGPVVSLAPIVIGSGGAIDGALDAAALGAWLALSAATAAYLLWTGWRLRRRRRAWEETDVLGRAVYLSGDCGPAVAGLVRPWIVLPRWALSLPEPDLGLVVLHEEEHVRAGDGALLGLGLLLVVGTPWSPVSWWQLRRLRAAVEVDCDRRVLRRSPDPARYGRSLLSVAEHARGPSLGLAAFTERTHSLERRILAMTEKRSRWSPLQAGALLALAGVVALQACGVAIPLADEAPEEAPVDVPSVEVAPPDGGATEPAPPPPVEAADLAEPTFTPFTVAPSIVNRREVIEAMEGAYPPLLRDAGIGGTVRMYFFIDADGRVQDIRIDRSSGHPALDQAAMSVASVYRFSPALNREDPVPVWVSFPITFQVR